MVGIARVPTRGADQGISRSEDRERTPRCRRRLADGRNPLAISAMILARVLIVAVQLGLPDGLEAARAAFDAGNYEQAETLALGEAASPRAGGALYLAGLARFRAGRPAEALKALDAAALAPDPPERAFWEFNRGACLYELGRHAEAEAAFLEAAALGGPIAAVALANAGFAALDGGSPDRARELARRAGTTFPAAAGLVADLEAAIAGPSSDDDPVRDDAEHADAAAVEEEDHARTPSRGLAGRGRGPRGSLHLESGYDDNVMQSGLETSREPVPGTGARTESAVGTTGGEFEYLWIPRARLAAEIAFAIDELAFLAPSAEDYSVLHHGFASQLELSVNDRLRVGAAILGHSEYTGIGELRGLQAGAGARSWLAIDEGARAMTRLTLEWTWKKGLSPQFRYLTGDRADALAEQDVQLRWVTLTASYRFRAEMIGTMREPALVPFPPICLAEPGACRYVIPLGFRSHTAAISAHGSPKRWLDLGAAVGFERRAYLGESYIDVAGLTKADGRWRVDDRLFTSVFAGWRLSRSLELGAHYDVVVSRSNIDKRPYKLGDPCPDLTCHALDYDDKNYTKNQVTADVALVF